MGDLIPRDAAAAVCDKHSYSNNPYVSGRMADAAAEIRAIPTIDPACDHCGVDPAAIREAALREAAAVVAGCTWGDYWTCDGEYVEPLRLSDAILTMIGEKK